MAFNPSDFAADTDFERFALERLGTHRVRPVDPDMVYDLDAKSITVKLGVAEEGSGRVNELRRALRPLGFGAAYKVLDLLVEQVLKANGTTGGRLTFADKARQLRGARPTHLPIPFDRRPDLWDRLTKVYVSLQEARHATVHRRAQVMPDGDLQAFDQAGQLIDTVSAAELQDFAASVHACAELVIEESSDSRRLNIVAWHLNGLQAHHRAQKQLPTTNPMADRGLFRADLVAVLGGLQFDVSRAREAIENQERAYWDLELRHPRANIVYVGRWEDIPGQSSKHLVFDPATPPTWLTEELAPPVH